MASNNYVPMYIFLGLLILVGFFLPFFIGQFVDLTKPNEKSIIYPVVDTFVNGIHIKIPLIIMTIDVGHFSFFNFMSSSMKESFSKYLYSFTYIDDYLLFPILLVMFASFVYFIVYLVIPTK